MPTPCLGGVEFVGTVACAAVSTVSVGVCGIANLKTRMNKKPYDLRDLTIERHKVNKVAQSVRCFKNGQELGTGTAMFDGEMLELPFLPGSMNLVAVSGMVVRSEGNIVQLTPKDVPITEFKMEFPEQSEAIQWSHYFQDAVNNITLSYHARVAELRNRIKMQERVIQSLHDQAGYGEEAAPIVDQHHQALMTKVASHREEMVDQASKLHRKITDLEAKIHEPRTVYQDHAARLDVKLREFESKMKNTGDDQELVTLKSENATLQMKVEELRTNKSELMRMADVLGKRLEALEKGQAGAGNSTALYSKVQALQANKEKVSSYAETLRMKLEALERAPVVKGEPAARAAPAAPDPAAIAKMQELEVQLNKVQAERDTIFMTHQQQLSAKDQELAQHIQTVTQHNQRLQMYQEQTPQLQQQVADYERQVMEQARQMQILEQQAQQAQSTVYDTAALEAVRAERSAALQRAEVAEAKLMSFEIEFQKAVNEANDHQLRADREALNAQSESEKAQSLHNEKEALMMQLQEAKAVAEEHHIRAARLQESQGSSAVHAQQLAAFQTQQQQDELAIKELENAIQNKDAQYDQMVMEVQQSKDQEINELMLTIDAKDQEVGALAGEVQALKEACAVIPQLEADREQLITTINQEREMAAKLEADVKLLEQQAGGISYEQECFSLQGQLRGSQQDLFAAQAKIVELEAKMENQAELAAQAVAAASLPLSPVSPLSAPRISVVQVENFVEPAPVISTMMETIAAPSLTTTMVEPAPVSTAYEVPGIPTMVETVSAASIVTQQPAMSSGRYPEVLTSVSTPTVAPTKVTYAGSYAMPRFEPVAATTGPTLPYGPPAAVYEARPPTTATATTATPATIYSTRSSGLPSSSLTYGSGSPSLGMGRPVGGTYSGSIAGVSLPPYPAATIRR